MWFEVFKIKTLEALFILLTCIPLGYFIYQVNSSKINYVFTIESSVLFAENYCEKYTEHKVPSILSNSELGKIQNILTSKINQDKPSYKTNIYIYYGGVNTPYQVVITGKDRDLKLMTEQVEFARMILSKEEISTFNQSFSKFKLVCQGKIYPVFAFFQPNNSLVNGSVRYAYSKNFLYLSALGPFIIFYLLILIYKLIRFNNIGFVIKK
jgi:hypothetical protein